jgi:hypothetical protein
MDDGSTHVTTGMMGTRGYVSYSQLYSELMCCAHRYVDPVYVQTQELSPACDIYSLAVTMLQLLTGDSAAFDAGLRPPSIITRYSARLATRYAS